MKLIARLLIALGLTLIAAGRKLDKPAPPVSKRVIELPRRAYRPATPRPGWFNSFVPVFATG